MSEDDILIPLYLEEDNSDLEKSDKEERPGTYLYPKSIKREENHPQKEKFVKKKNNLGYSEYRNEANNTESSSTAEYLRKEEFRPESVYEENYYSSGYAKEFSHPFGISNARKEKKAVNQLVYAFLAIFLGSFGVHKFYSGKYFLGILYLLFCWTMLPAVIGFIEGLASLAKKTDSDGNIFA